MKKIIEALNDKKIIPINGYGFVINPLTEQIPFTSAELLRETCQELSKKINLDKTNKIITEEDRGAILVAGVSLQTGLPFGLARWQPSGLPEQVEQSFKMEYTSGILYLNGVEKEDQVIIIDDLLSTGGTIIGLVKAIQKVGASISQIICVADKINYNGKKRIKKETGYEVETLFSLDVSGPRSKVIFNK